MEIDLDKPTQEQIDAMKKAMPGLAGQLGVIDPSQPLDKEVAEKLTFKNKVSGNIVEKSIWDWVQSGSKAEGAETSLREAKQAKEAAKDALAKVEAQARFRTALQNGEMPETEDIKIAAEAIGQDPQTILDALTPTEGDDKGKKTMQPTANAQPTTISHKNLDPGMQDDMAYLKEKKAEDAQKEVARLLNQALDKSERVTTLIAKKGSHKDAADNLRQSLFNTSKKFSQGRFRNLEASATQADILREIDESVNEAVDNAELSGIAEPAAPQPIILEPSEPGQQAITVLSDEKVPVGDISDPDWAENFTKISMQQQVKAAEEEKT